MGWCQCTKASERKRLKELGNKTGRKFARCPGQLNAGLQQKIANRLFIKNTGPCKREICGIRADACPVPVSEEEGFPDLSGQLRIQAPVNGSSNYNCSTVAKFLVG